MKFPLSIYPFLLCFLQLFACRSQSLSDETLHAGSFPWPIESEDLKVEHQISNLLQGPSSHFRYLQIDAVHQQADTPPLELSSSDMEQLIIVKEGRLNIAVGTSWVVLGPTSVCLVPPGTDLAIENKDSKPASYYRMQFQSQTETRGTQEKATIPMLLDAEALVFQPRKKGGRIDYFERPTTMCKKFEMHVTQLNEKGPSHNPHAHVDSEIIIVISGSTEMTIAGESHQGSAGHLYFIPSHDFHGISNVGNTPCKYYAFRWY